MVMYWLRVFLISFEFLIVVISVFLVNVYGETINALIKEIQINDEILKWLMFVPAGLFVWSFSKAKLLLFPDGHFSKILHKWPDYRKLKIHFWVAIIYSVLFLIASLLPLFIKDGLNTGTGFIVFFCGLVGESIVAFCIYLAQIAVDEILIHTES